jgi:hypothetical protein
VNLGVVVDGQAEALAYPYLLRRIQIAGVSFLNPIYADMQPKATPAQIVRAASSKLALAINRGAHRQVLLIDFEDRDGCSCTFAESITASLRKFGFKDAFAVVKNRRFENWLVADVAALKQMPARFELTAGFVNMVVPNRADNVKDAEREIGRICKHVAFNKREDPAQILRRASELRLARNSRSFRRFLRLATHPAYAAQSKRPA